MNTTPDIRKQEKYQNSPCHNEEILSLPVAFVQKVGPRRQRHRRSWCLIAAMVLVCEVGMEHRACAPPLYTRTQDVRPSK